MVQNAGSVHDKAPRRGAESGQASAAEALEEALSLLQEGRLGDAQTVTRAVLEREPDHPEALHTMGLIGLRAGHCDEAIPLLQRAVALREGDVTFHANLGAALEDAGRLEEAFGEYRRAVELEPGFADMHYRIGNACAELGRPAEAIPAYERTVALDPAYAEAHYNLGNARTAVGRLQGALDAFQRALELMPDFAQAHCNQGNVYGRLGEYERAVACYRRALEIDPEFVLGWSNLGLALSELGRPEAALEAYDRAIAIDPGYARAHSNRGVTLKALGREEEAMNAYRRALEADPDFPDARFNLANVLRGLGRLDEALAAYRGVLERNPNHAFACTNIGTILVEQGDPGAALQVCDRFLEEHAGETGVLACRALALTDLGAREQVQSLVDFDRLVMGTRFDAPAGFASLGEFNAALERHILAHPSLREDPSTHATRNGSHTGDLLAEPRGPIAAYERMIHVAVAAYMDAHPTDPGHPFLAHRPSNYRLDIWAVVMPADGHQIPHIHPSAWLSGVYYPKVPQLVQRPDADHAGWIEFGEPADDWRHQVPAEVRPYQPEPGKMFLFPSYFWHRTIPFASAETRISIAFDVIPSDD